MYLFKNKFYIVFWAGNLFFYGNSLCDKQIYRYDATSFELRADIKPLNIEKRLCEQLCESAPVKVKDIIAMLSNPQQFDDCLPTKILLVGPPGVGKTTLASVIAQKSGRSCLFISAPTLANEYKNSGAQNLQRQIELAIALDHPLVIIIDELAALIDHYKDTHNQDANMTETLWIVLDLCATSKNIFVVATANDISKMPEQLKSRFEGQVVEIKLQNDFKSKAKVLRFYLDKFKHYCDESDVSSLVSKMKNFSPRQIEELVKQAAQNARFRVVDVGAIEFADVKDAFESFQESHKILDASSPIDYDKWCSRLSGWATVTLTAINLITLAINMGEKKETIYYSPYIPAAEFKGL